MRKRDIRQSMAGRVTGKVLGQSFVIPARGCFPPVPSARVGGCVGAMASGAPCSSGGV